MTTHTNSIFKLYNSVILVNVIMILQRDCVEKKRHLEFIATVLCTMYINIIATHFFPNQFLPKELPGFKHVWHIIKWTRLLTSLTISGG